MTIPAPPATWDVWIARSPADADKVTAALKAFGFSASSISPTFFLTPNKVFRMGNPPLRVEVLTDISGVEFSACWNARESAIIGGITIDVINLDDLKRNKSASGRLKDKNDLVNLPQAVLKAF